MIEYEHKGVSHYELLETFHRDLTPRSYFEIGTLQGGTLCLSKCPTVCVDPSFQIKVDPTGAREATMLFQKTSDRFFQDHNVTQLFGGPVELAFLDGLHEAETLLRDFANIERHCKPNSIVCLHDCVPMNVGQTVRAINGGLWTGDVWKVLPILKKYLPDIDIYVFDAYPTGLVCCTNLDADNTVLRENCSSIWREWGKIELEEYGFEKFIQECSILPTSLISSPEELRRYFYL